MLNKNISKQGNSWRYAGSYQTRNLNMEGTSKEIIVNTKKFKDCTSPSQVQVETKKTVQWITSNEWIMITQNNEESHQLKDLKQRTLSSYKLLLLPNWT